MRRGILLLGLFFVMSSPVRAEEKYTFIIEKQETKAKHRWSLSDWLETRDKMRLMDLWLAMHSPSPYEFYLGAAYKSGNLSPGGGYRGWDFTFAAYAYLFGAEVQYQTANLENRILALVNFRAFGVYNQATNLTFQVGQKQSNRGAGGYWNTVAGANFTLYIAKNFGTVLLYRHTFSRATGLAASQDQAQMGAFIDFNFVRLHADYMMETEVGNPAFSYSGFQVGTRLYF